MTYLPAIVILDTNFLLERPFFLKENWLLKPLEILISETVIGELHGLTGDPDVSSNAITALAELDRIQAKLPSGENRYQEDDITVVFASRITDAKPPLNPSDPDHQLIEHARRIRSETSDRFCSILTADRKLCRIAEALGLIVVLTIIGGNQFHGELRAKYVWWIRSKEAALEEEKEIKEKDVTKPPVSQVRFERVMQHVYGRVRADHHRTLLHLAPLSARIGLTNRIIQRVPKPESRAVLLIVESIEASRYWAGEIRQRGGYSSSDVQIFGHGFYANRIEKARVLIYRHDQVTRRLSQHIDRLKNVSRSLTAVVDSCDLLDAVDLALLLFECDQFIGFHHYPIGLSQLPGSRILDTFLRDKSTLAYTFADADRDGWGHPFDPYFHPVTFTPEEQTHWDEINTSFLKKQERAKQKHKELKEADDFWEELHKLLLKTVGPEEASLITLREEREGRAQLAQGKIKVVKKIINQTPKQPYRRLIFDYERQWTPILLNQLAKTDAQVTELEEGDTQRTIWNQFAGRKWDTLILSDTPPIRFPGAHIHQLIILTPLRPISEISSMIDWTLEHTQSKDSLRIEVVYVKETPEELAMLDLAEACFGLSFYDMV